MTESWEEQVALKKKQLNLSVGDIYEDCAYHPVRCTSIDFEEDDITGISLVDSSGPRSCSLYHCGVRKLSEEEAQNIVKNGPSDPEALKAISKDEQWW